MRRCCFIVAWIGVMSVVSAADADINGYELLSDWNLLPQARLGVQAGLASSYDRNGGNYDYNHYESTGSVRQTADVDPVTVVTLDGPGVITRFWMPHRAADLEFKVKVLLDDVVVIDSTSRELLGGGYGYIDGALGSTMLGGQVSYEPIVYSDSQTLKIVSENKFDERHYYQWNYLKLPAGSTVTPYSGTLTPQQTTARNSAISMTANVGSNPAGTSATSNTISTASQSIGAGQAIALGDISGSGQIRAINLKLADTASDGQMDGLRLRVRYDGLSRAGVDVPVSHFFGAGHGRVAYQSMPLGASDSNEFYSYWPMPFRRGVSVELYNDSGDAISIDSAAVEYESGSVADDACYLHAEYNSVATTTDPSYQLLRTAGRGHYVGNLLWLDRQNVGSGSRFAGRSILEGDDIITVNVNSASPVVLPGTGLEDAYNGGYYYNHVGVHPDEEAYPYSGVAPYHGLLRANIPLKDNGGSAYAHTDQYRWLIPDPVPFTDGIKVDIEQYASSYGASFGSVAFYYLLPFFGDANDDMRVDLYDFAILRGDFGEIGQGLAADFDEDGDVDLDDYEILVSTFGMISSPGLLGAAPDAEVLPANLTIPEPVSLMLFAVVAWPVVRRRRSA
ncbi:MAG: DUF2961 domain-containing protein [Phycisphaerae bacterium]|jgi:hypothetical protein|nr:DUF2961 domain-containing protein [Phycisphaerae bacterium]